MMHLPSAEDLAHKLRQLNERTSPLPDSQFHQLFDEAAGLLESAKTSSGIEQQMYLMSCMKRLSKIEFSLDWEARRSQR